MIKLIRHPLNPLISPVSQHHWESKYVFNCAVINRDGVFHMLYRAQGEDMVSRIGYAVSLDGLRFNRFEKPVFTPGSQWELYGVEDPRLTELEGKIYMQYTAYSPQGIRISMASTVDFVRWERYGIIIPDVDDKDAALFPKKVRGRYLMFHRIEPDMHLAYSDDLETWSEFTSIAGPRPDMWDNLKIGVGAPPIETEYGWLVLYHGVENTPRPTYRLGFMVLDLENPEKIIKRSEEPILEPEEEWEIFGGVPNVVFSDAMVEYEDHYYVYYGAADNHIAVATIEKEAVEDWIRS